MQGPIPPLPGYKLIARVPITVTHWWPSKQAHAAKKLCVQETTGYQNVWLRRGRHLTTIDPAEEAEAEA